MNFKHLQSRNYSAAFCKALKDEKLNAYCWKGEYGQGLQLSFES